jgi:hypothetical protein
MKLRIHDNSIRLRLTRSEIARFASAGAIESAIEFGPAADQQMRYGLESSPDASELEVRFEDRQLRILMPAGTANEWTAGDRVELTGSQSLKGGKRLEILVEKEFRRLHGANANPDLYPNPLESSLPKH